MTQWNNWFRRQNQASPGDSELFEKVEQCCEDECESGEGCLFNLLVIINGEQEEVIEDLDPCEENNITVNITYVG